MNFIECNCYCGIKFSGCLLRQSKFGFELVYRGSVLTNFEYGIQEMIKVLDFLFVILI